MDYAETPYRQLKQLCAKRGLGGAGKRLELVMKLRDADADKLQGRKAIILGPEPAVDMPDGPIPEQPVPDPKRPPFADWDADGRWVRRPKHFISWAEEERKWDEEHERNYH
jgi:hypothetical protein